MYLREPPGDPPNTFNGKVWKNTKHIEEHISYYLREPPGGPPTTKNDSRHTLSHFPPEACIRTLAVAVRVLIQTFLAARSARRIFLDYLREPPGAKVRTLSHTTSASLPADRPLLKMIQDIPESFSAGGRARLARHRL